MTVACHDHRVDTMQIARTRGSGSTSSLDGLNLNKEGALKKGRNCGERN